MLDTNTVISGFLWENQPRAIIDAAVGGRIQLFTSAGLIAELAGVLPRQKFAKRLVGKQLSIPALIERYRVLADLVEPAMLSVPVSKDPDDDLTLASASRPVRYCSTESTRALMANACNARNS